jgi:tetratricopeptide (TPR) repeat protein
MLLLCAILVVAGSTAAQKRIPCPDGEHIEIDIKQIAIQYDASSFAGTLSSLSVLGGRLEVAPRKLQEAAVATQQWDEFLKGLVVGYNTCAVTRQQYADGINRIYPRLQEDAASLEEIRKIISNGQKADEKRLQSLIDSYYANLRQFAEASGKEIILEQIEALSEQVRSGQTQIVQKADVIIGQNNDILARLNELRQKNAQSPPPTPVEVSNEISDLRKNLLAKADEAEFAYTKGYDLLERYRFREAVPYFEQAAAAIQLPDFYLALGRAYEGLPDLGQAQAALKKGLNLVAARKDEVRESELAGQLGSVLLLMGDLDAALTWAQRSLEINERVYGPNHAQVAHRDSDIGAILTAKGDLDGALSYTLLALKIEERAYGPDDPTVAICANNIGQILQFKGDLKGALNYTQRALEIDEKFYGPDHPSVGVRANNMGVILTASGDLDGALHYAQQALTINERVFGPDHPIVATCANNIGQILQDKGDLDDALSYTQRALKIDENTYGTWHPDVGRDVLNIGHILGLKGDLDGGLTFTLRALKIEETVYGLDSPKVAICADNVAQILKAKGEFDAALSYAQRALKIDEKAYGLDNPDVAICANTIGTILQDKGDLDGALTYTQRALKIDEKAYGLSHPKIAADANNIGTILKQKGDLDGALAYVQRALKILVNAYGPDNPKTRTVAANLEIIKQAMQK